LIYDDQQLHGAIFEKQHAHGFIIADGHGLGQFACGPVADL
jgi:hypothetical protein